MCGLWVVVTPSFLFSSFSLPLSFFVSFHFGDLFLLHLFVSRYGYIVDLISPDIVTYS